MASVSPTMFKLSVEMRTAKKSDKQRKVRFIVHKNPTRKFDTVTYFTAVKIYKISCIQFHTLTNCHKMFYHKYSPFYDKDASLGKFQQILTRNFSREGNVYVKL